MDHVEANFPTRAVIRKVMSVANEASTHITRYNGFYNGFKTTKQFGVIRTIGRKGNKPTMDVYFHKEVFDGLQRL